MAFSDFSHSIEALKSDFGFRDRTSFSYATSSNSGPFSSKPKVKNSRTLVQDSGLHEFVKGECNTHSQKVPNYLFRLKPLSKAFLVCIRHAGLLLARFCSVRDHRTGELRIS
jgi:hypothetical protein